MLNNLLGVVGAITIVVVLGLQSPTAAAIVGSCILTAFVVDKVTR